MGANRPDSRDVAMLKLQEVLRETFETSLAAQLCARGRPLNEAKEIARQRDTPLYRDLITPDGGSGYVQFQWMSQSFLKIADQVAKVQEQLPAFWTSVDADQPTHKIYEDPLHEALAPINGSVTAIGPNLKSLFRDYPDNKIGMQSLALLAEVKNATNYIEHSIKSLLLLSPPAKPRLKSKLTWRVVALAFLVAVLTWPVVYWQHAGGPTTTIDAVAKNAVRQVKSVAVAATDQPSELPKRLHELVPTTSDVLLLLSAFLGMIRAFSTSDLQKMIKELSRIAHTLKDANG